MSVPVWLLLGVVASVTPAANRATRRRAKKVAPIVPPITDSAGIPRPAITIQRAARTYDIAYSTLRQWIREGKLPAYRLADGRQVRVYVEDLEALFIQVGSAEDPRTSYD